MADTFTSTDPASLGTSLVQGAYDKLVEFQNRHMPLFRQLADKRPVQVDKPGDSVTFQFYNDLAEDTTPLNEITDPDIAGIPSTSSVSVQLNEYGKVVASTSLLRAFAMSDVDPAIANILAANQRGTIDTLVRDTLSTGSQVVAPVSSASISADDVRAARLTLVENAAQPRVQDYYACYLHPRVSYDLKKDATPDGFIEVHKYAAPDVFFSGTVGLFEGVFFVESSRAKSVVSGVSPSQITTYHTLFAGQQALAEAVAIEPHTVVNGVIVDALRRKYPIGWYGVLGWGVYRDKSLVRVETQSSRTPAV